MRKTKQLLIPGYMLTFRHLFFNSLLLAFPTVPFNSLFFLPKYFVLMICWRKYALKFGGEQFAFVLRLNE